MPAIDGGRKPISLDPGKLRETGHADQLALTRMYSSPGWTSWVHPPFRENSPDKLQLREEPGLRSLAELAATYLVAHWDQLGRTFSHPQSPWAYRLLAVGLPHGDRTLLRFRKFLLMAASKS